MKRSLLAKLVSPHIIALSTLTPAVNTLTTYFCARLSSRNDDPSFRYGIKETAASLRVIVNWQHFVPDDAVVVTTTIFALSDYSVMRDLTPATRLELLQVIDSLFRNRGVSLIKKTGTASLVTGLVEFATHEKNPMCLKVLFPLFSHLSKEWNMDDSQFDSLWNSFSRYFPITVGGPVRDPKQPSQELLRDLLLECMMSNDAYAKSLIPMCLEKLDTTADLSANTKV